MSTKLAWSQFQNVITLAMSNDAGETVDTTKFLGWMNEWTATESFSISAVNSRFKILKEILSDGWGVAPTTLPLYTRTRGLNLAISVKVAISIFY